MIVGEAIAILSGSHSSWSELAEAIGVLANDSSADYDSIELGLRHKGFVAEQAKLALILRWDPPALWREWDTDVGVAETYV